MTEWYGVIIIVLTVVGANTMLHRDLASVRERMAKLEGTIEGFMAGTRPPA